MSSSLLIDPRSEKAANAPLEIGTEVDRGPGVYVTSHAYPDPPMEPRSTSAGREGSKRSGPPARSNRQVPLSLFLVGDRQTTADRTNLSPRPSGDSQAGWTSSVTGATLNAGAFSTTWSRVRERSYYLKATGNGAGQTAQILCGSAAADRAAVVAGTTYTVSAWINLLARGAGQFSIALEWRTAADALISTSVLNVAPAVGESRISGSAAAPATAATVRVLIGHRATLANGEVLELYADALLVEATTELRDFGDGDELGWAWSGTALASTSTRSGNPQIHFERMAADLEQKLWKLAEEGGTFTRPYEAGRLIFDVEGLAEGSAGEYDGKRWRQKGAAWSASLECLPYPRGEEIVKTLTASPSGAFGVLEYTESDIPGTVRALGQLEITDTASPTQARRAVVAGIQVENYDAAATAKLYYQGEEMTPLGGGVTASLSGARGPAGLGAPCSGSSVWTSQLSTQLVSGSAHLTHVGTYRVWARIFVPMEAAWSFRLEWGQGDLLRRELNDPFSVPARAAFALGNYQAYLVDLGIVRLERAKAGPQQWEGRIQSKTTTPVSFSYVDDVAFVPVDEAYLEASATDEPPTAAYWYTRDEFDHATAVLAGRTPPGNYLAGGVWTGFGSANDFSTISGLGVAFRTAVSDASLTGGRYEVHGAARTEEVVQVDVSSDSLVASSVLYQGLVSRFTDANNNLRLVFGSGVGNATDFIQLTKRKAGADTDLLPPGGITFVRAAGTTYTLRLSVQADGTWIVWAGLQGQGLTRIAGGRDVDLITGGTLASGKHGIYDAYTSATALTRRYDNFGAYVPGDQANPGPDVAIAPGRALRWRHDGVVRRGRATTPEVWTPVNNEGDPLLVPPTRRDKRTLRLIVFPSRGDLSDIPDGRGATNAGEQDDFTAQLTITPRYLSVRR